MHMLHREVCEWSTELPSVVQPRAVNHLRLYVIQAFFCVLLAGCFASDFIGSYFNTYYNAQRLFSEAEEEIRSQRDPKRFDKVYLAPYNIQASTKTKLTSVIEKCSKILQYHQESSLVDDALMMIGKSYHYQDENQQAERKFNELIDTYPKSSLVLEARLLLSQSLYRMNEKEKAATAAGEVIEAAREMGKDDMASRASFLLGHVELETKNYADARSHFLSAAQNAGSAEGRTRAYFKLAETCELESDFNGALDSYRKAGNASNNYIATYRGLLGEARMLSKLQRFDEASALLGDLRSSSNYREFFGEVDYEIANTYQEKGELENAIEQYMYVDTAYTRTEYSANSHYRLGLLYETTLFRYDSARAVYGRGRNESPQAAITPLIAKRADYLNRYFLLLKDIQTNDSLKALVLQPPDTSAYTDSLKVEPGDSSSAGGEGVAGVTGVVGDSVRMKSKLQPRVTIPLDTLESRLASGKAELAALFYTTIGIVDSAKKWYLQLLSDHPRSRHAPRAIFTLAQIHGDDTTGGAALAESLYRRLIVEFPESEFAAEAERRLGLPPKRHTQDEVEDSYSRGEQLFLRGHQNAAVDTFKSIVARYPTSPLASKAQYAIGWIYEQTKPDSAIPYYERLVVLYPTSQYASIVRMKLAEVSGKKHEGEAKGDSVATPPKQDEEKDELDDFQARRRGRQGVESPGTVKKPLPPDDAGEDKVPPR
jgi:TolA-binding protein